jgi:hypothetical protein
MNILTNVLGKSPFNFLRLGIHGERKYFVKPNLFGGIAFNGSLVALTPEATGTFLAVKMEENKPFFIDPLTYAFALSPIHIIRPEDRKVRKSILKMAEFYGDALKQIVGKRSISPSEFKDEKIKKELCAGVLNFQELALRESLKEDIDYFEKIGVDISKIAPKPTFLIPPYFYLDITYWQDWIGHNIDFVENALRLEKDIPVLCEIVISREFLHRQNELLILAGKYAQLKCRGFLIWVGNFPEYEATVDEIVSLRLFIKELSKTGSPIINLYGGYLSALLSFDGLKGFCHGPGYGEERDIVPVGGGLPYPKYYFTPLHRRLPSELVEWLVVERRFSPEEFYSKICDCPKCKQILQNGIMNFAQFGEKAHMIRVDGLPISYATERAKEINNFHFLYARHKELSDVQSTSKESLLHQLTEAEKEYLRELSAQWVSHLRVWYEALSKTI